MGTFKAVVDWNNDGFLCRWAKRTDTLQSLRTWLADPLDLHEYLSTFTDAVATINIATAADGSSEPTESRYFGKEYYSVDVAGAGSHGIRIFTDGATNTITTTSGKVYTVVFWIKSSDNALYPLGTNYSASLRTNGGLNIETTATGLVSSAGWNRVALTFTASASNNLQLRIVKTDAAARKFFVAGIMVFESASAITAPDGYNTGFATDLYEDITQDLKQSIWQIGMFKPYQQMADEGYATLTLDNSSQLYTPENASSALYGYITPGKWFEICHWTGAPMTGRRVMYTGQLDSPVISLPYQTAAENTGKTECTLKARSNKIWLDAQDFEHAQTSGNVGSLIKDMLRFTNLATAYGFNYVGLTGPRVESTTGYAPGATDSAWKAISDLVAVEEGKFYLGRGGTVNLLSKYYSYDGSSLYAWNSDGGTTVSANAGTISESGSYKPFQALDYAYGANYINRVRVTANKRTAGASGTVWSQTGIDLDIAAGDTDLLYVRLRDSQGRFTSCESVAISSMVFTSGTATVTATAMGGKAKIELNNSAGTVVGTLSSLALTATSNTQSNDIAIEIGAAGTATYGIRMQSYSLAACGSARQARKIARHILNRDNRFQGYVYSVPFLNKGDGTANAHQLEWGIGTKVRVDIDSYSHDRDYWIIGEKHEVMQDGIAHKTTFALEPTSTTSFWVAGVEGFSNAGVSTRAG